MNEYDLYLPLSVEGLSRRTLQKRLSLLKRELTREFGGLTYFPQENEGQWRFGGVTYHDKIVILRVLSSNRKSAESCLKKIKRLIRRDWKQTDVLIIARSVRAL